MSPAKAKASGRATLAQMREIPVADTIFGKSTIRDDGRVIHPMYLFDAKSPAQSKETWDLVQLKNTIPAARAFRPIDEGRCPMIHA
jgi:branched-chain amino acid transport system substrate-binding protein